MEPDKESSSGPDESCGADAQHPSKLHMLGLPHKVALLTRTQHTLQALLANANRDIASLLDAQQASDAALASTRAELQAARADNLRLRQQLSLRPDDKQATPRVESGSEVAQVDQAEMRDLEEKLHEAELSIAAWKQRFHSTEEERRKLHNELQEIRGNIRVFCRIRPEPAHHKTVLRVGSKEEGEDTTLVFADPKTGRSQKFRVDRVFPSDTTQTSVFLDACSVVQSVVDGHNGCIFAYGQTGSGKTHTMLGPPDDPGIIPRALGFLFERLSAWPASSVTMSCIEVYNETVQDLLCEPPSRRAALGDATNRDTAGLKVEGACCGADAWVEGAVWEDVTSKDHALCLLQSALHSRAVGQTQCNKRSSRSHCVVSLRIMRREDVDDTPQKSRLNLIDLAGSERVKISAAKGQRLKEATSINTSLSSLGQVLNALKQRGKLGPQRRGSRPKHVPFRNSKLTHLLQGSLENGAKTLMVACVNSLVSSAPETLCTLSFATKASGVALGQSKRLTAAAPGAT